METGKCYYVRCNNDHWVGRVKEANLLTATLEDASWVADSGRLSVFMAKGKADNMEIEPVGEVTVKWDAYLPWPHKLFDKAI